LDIAIGQFDTYTPLQLAQYVSVIANGGFRVQPRIVTSIHAPVEYAELGRIVVDKSPNISFQRKLRQLTKRNWSVSLDYRISKTSYFRMGKLL
jgi:cell division protein FtsI/penicillin-binding protein 2